MDDSLILPHAGHISEFYTDSTGKYWNGTCTQTALEVCLACAEGRAPTQAHMAELVRRMVAAGTAGTSGAATVAAVSAVAHALGHSIALEWDYAEPLAGDWHAHLLADAGHRPILLQIANGAALVDTETGIRDEAGLHYHAIAIVGKTPQGYVCADGDHPQVTTRFQIYSYATLAAANPCGLLILDMPSGGTPVTIPTGWTDDGTKLIAPNGNLVVRGFRDLIHNAPSWDAADQPLEVERIFGAASVRQIFHRSVLHWDGAHCWSGDLGAEFLQNEVDAAAQRDQFTKQIAALQSQLAANADAAQLIALLHRLVA